MRSACTSGSPFRTNMCVIPPQMGVATSGARRAFGQNGAVSDLVAKALEGLRLAGVRFEPGLTDAEVATIQRDLDVAFGPEHSELLQAALPVGSPSWPDWRTDSADTLAARLDWPIDGVVFDVLNNAFWPSSWGERPADPEERERRARVQLDGVPRLVRSLGIDIWRSIRHTDGARSSRSTKLTSSSTATTCSIGSRTSSRSCRYTLRRQGRTCPSGQTSPKALRARTSRTAPTRRRARA